MKLSQAVRSGFGSGDRMRGAAYFRDGRVLELRLESDNSICAVVGGSYADYEVSVVQGGEDGRFGFACDCPRFNDGFPCKHIWATILAIEDRASGRGVDLDELGARATPPSKSKAGKSQQTIAWQRVLEPLAFRPLRDEQSNGAQLTSLATDANAASEIFWVVDVGGHSAHTGESLELSVFRRLRKKDGEWGKPKSFPVSHAKLNEILDPVDRQIVSRLLGAEREYALDHYGYSVARNSFNDFEISRTIAQELLALLAQTGRFFWTLSPDLGAENYTPVGVEDFARPWTIRLDFEEVSKPKNGCRVSVVFDRDGKERLNNDNVLFVADNGIALLADRLIQFDNPLAASFWRQVHADNGFVVKKSERLDFLKRLATVGGLPEFEIPKSWQTGSADKQSAALQPRGCVKLNDQVAGYRNRPTSYLHGDISFDYGCQSFDLSSTNLNGFDESTGQWIKRDTNAERTLLANLASFPITDKTQQPHVEHDFSVHRKHLVRLVDELGAAGWDVKLRGQRVKQAGAVTMSVTSDQDWFDLSAEVDFEGSSVKLPELLAAIKQKSEWITLADGSQGRLSSRLLDQYSRIAQFGTVEGDKVRFRPTQAMLLDAMLDSQDNVTVDRGFQKLRKKLKSFSGIKPKSPPKTFKGELREYQRDGLGWLHFLRQFGFGGCLADDMGLGKTIQVLSLLESRRTRKADLSEVKAVPVKMKSAPSGKKENQAAQTIDVIGEALSAKPTKGAAALLSAVDKSVRKPSIVVVPKSLVFNWIEEAAKFTPNLRILNYTGTVRKQNAIESEGFDVLITTYGTLRKDISDLSAVEFDYAILDESQAIKNSAAQCAKSSRLIRASHRLAMTGTPIENHLGELWSLFEFLNPGMLGASSNFASLTRQAKSNEEQRGETLQALAKAMQPFILRRTKDQVLKELPSKTEQTLYCDMLPAQKKQYNELKEYYRVKLAKDVETKGVGKSKIHVLEALLRLRQVACDPRLLDKSNKPGAKLELLQQQLGEVIAEGHKVLVFSQFTSLLALVRQQLDEAGVTYEYLDGKTSNRQAPVKRFQEDPSVSAFLISLKAGGHGLNLTSADYVFLLDPWWNPAVEAQAIDRAHRMGQQRPVIAYRMICRDTVEEKIVKLQESKRKLADSVIRADESLLRTLTADDIQVLLS